MTQIEVKHEVEGRNEWRYKVTLTDDGTTYNYDVSLNWQDYDLWTRGRVAPNRVIHAAFTFLLEREPASSIMSKFDCSVIRRYLPQVDAELPKLLTSRDQSESM